MATANFYVNHSDKLKVEKNLSQVITDKTITIIEPVDIFNPVIKLSKEIGSLSFNYLYISDFNRYYFVTEPPTWREGFYEVKLHCDVLMSFKHSFYTKHAIIKRNSSRYNLYLNDDHMKIYNYPYYQTLNMACVEGTPFNMARNEICLALVGAVDSQGGGE
jgi:hypothetical protein